MKVKGQNATPGIYLVIDPSMDEGVLLDKLAKIVNERIFAVQLWDNFGDCRSVEKIIQKVYDLCSPKNIPLIINNRWEYLLTTPANGVHFDRIPENYDYIKAEINRKCISGLTCNNDLSHIHWAEENRLDYISFCSMFPSTTATSCDLVNFETVRQARRIFTNPIFLAGGIRPGNLSNLGELDYDGVAVVSGIMSVDDPVRSIHEYNEYLKKKR